MIISSIIKGFFSSVWSALRTWRQDRERVHNARLESERQEWIEKDKILSRKKAVENDNSNKKRNLNDVLDDF